MKTPWVPFDYYLTGGIGGQFAFIAEPTGWPPGSQTNPIGTGPFVFEEWVPERPLHRHQEPPLLAGRLPYLDSITYKPIPDADQLLASLKSGSDRHHAHRHRPR